MSLSIVFGIPATTTFNPRLLHSWSLKIQQNPTNICDEFQSLPIQILHLEEFLNQEIAIIQLHKM
jgi:hypothetical protein